MPHWIALSPDRRRVVVTGYARSKHRVLIATFDSTTGALALDARFRPRGRPSPGGAWRGLRMAPCLDGSTTNDKCRLPSALRTEASDCRNDSDRQSLTPFQLLSAIVTWLPSLSSCSRLPCSFPSHPVHGRSAPPPCRPAMPASLTMHAWYPAGNRTGTRAPYLRDEPALDELRRVNPGLAGAAPGRGRHHARDARRAGGHASTAAFRCWSSRTATSPCPATTPRSWRISRAMGTRCSASPIRTRPRRRTIGGGRRRARASARRAPTS